MAGPTPRVKVQTLVADAAMLVLPSTCYEGNPKTVIEAFASGTPVVGSRLGGIAEAVTRWPHRPTVRDRRRGRVGDASRLDRAHPAEVAGMRARRAEFEAEHQAD